MFYICVYMHTLPHIPCTHRSIYTYLHILYTHVHWSIYTHYIITQVYIHTHTQYTYTHRSIYRHTHIHAVLFYNLFNFLVLSKAQSALLLILKNQDLVPKTVVTQSYAAGAGHPAHPARPTGLRALGGPVPSDGFHLSRCPGLPFSGGSEQGSHKTDLHKAPPPPRPPVPKTWSLLTAPLPCLPAPGTVGRHSRARCHPSQSRHGNSLHGSPGAAVGLWGRAG